MKNFWKDLKKPIIVLAPMADVTDIAFRTLFAKYGKPDVMWTEFVSADGLVLAPSPGREILMKDLLYGEEERPIVAQLFSGTPNRIEEAAKLVQDLGFDGIDINMGCPDKSIEKQKSGAALIKNPKLARELIRACKKGASDIPISVKTRIGYNKDQLEEWLPELLKENPAVITFHARTRKEMSKVPANWERIKRAVQIRNEFGSDTLILGNGDVLSLESAKEKVRETGCDGVMIGKGIFGNPWIFNKEINKEDLSLKERLGVLIEHTKLFEKHLSHKSFSIMKKHFKAYVDGFVGAKELRIQLMQCNNGDEIEKVIKDFLAK